MQSTYERFANRLSSEHRDLLSLAVGYQLAKNEQTSGRYLRLSFPLEAEEQARHLLDTLVPEYLGTWGADPMDRYWLTPVGLLLSSYGPRVGEIIEDVLKFFRTRLSRNPMLSSFSWEDLKEARVASGEDEFALVLLTLHTMTLVHGGSSTSGPPPAFSYSLPYDIERLTAPITTVEPRRNNV